MSILSHRFVSLSLLKEFAHLHQLYERTGSIQVFSRVDEQESLDEALAWCRDFLPGFALRRVREHNAKIAIAECVSNTPLAEALCEMGVDYLQGYYYGKAEPLEKLLKHELQH